MSRQMLSLFAVAFCSTAFAVDPTPHPGRRETSTPGIVLETGARTAACDALFFTSDGKHLLATGDDKVVRSWAVSDSGTLRTDNLPTLRWPLFREVRGNIYAAALSPDQSKVAFGGNGRTSGGFAVAVADRLTGELLDGSDTPPGFSLQGNIWAISFSPSGNRVALGTDRGFVWLWDLPSKTFTQLGMHTEPKGVDEWYHTVRLVAFVDEDTILSACGNKELVQWNAKEPNKPKLLHQFGGYIATPVVLSQDRKWIGAVLEVSETNKYLEVELVSFPEPTQKRKIVYAAPDDQHYSIPHRLAFNSDSTKLAVGVRIVGNRKFDDSIKMFQERGGRVDLYDLTATELKPTPGPKQSLYAEGLAFHPINKNWLAIAGGDNHDVTLWDIQNREQLGEVKQPGRCIWGVALSPDGQAIAYQTQRDPAATHPNRRSTGNWQAFNLSETKFLPELPFPVKNDHESLSGWKVQTTTKDGKLQQFWTLKSPEGEDVPIPWSRADDEFPRCYAFVAATANQPERLVIGHYWGASVFELSKNSVRKVRSLRGHEGYVTALAVSGDGQRVVTASRDMTLAGWSLADWPDHPRLGAELFQRQGRLFVGKMASGSPIWELGLEPGDEIVSLRVPDPDKPGQQKIIYDVTEANLPNSPQEALTFLNTGLMPGREHVVYWKRPNADTVYGAITTLLDRPLWRFFPQANQDWIIWQWRDYRYAASSLGDALVGWQTSFPFSKLRTPVFHAATQLRSEFHQPEVVQKTLSSWQSQQVLVEFNKLQPPGVTVSDPTPTVDGFAITVTAKPQGTLETQQPGRLLFWVNDYLLLDERLPSTATGTLERNLVIPRSKLRNGTNLVSSQCYARSGARGDAKPKSFEYKHEQPTARTLHGLIVGVSDYGRSKPKQVQLTAADDARVLQRALTRQKGKGHFAEVQSTLLLNAQVTRQNVLDKLDALEKTAKPDDVLILYLGGHGTSRDQLKKQKVPASLLQGVGRYLFLCGDANTQQLPSTTISFEDFQDKLSKLPCHKLVLLDSCHSGEAEISGGNNEANPIRVLTEHGVGPVILAASGYDQQAIENDALDPLGGGHGLFTIAIRKIMEERPSFLSADKNKDNILTTEELGDAMTWQMKRLLDEHNTILKRLGEKGNDVQTPVAFIPRLEASVSIVGK